VAKPHRNYSFLSLKYSLFILQNRPTTLTLAVPESCFLLGAQATFDRGANPASLSHPPGALGGVADNSRDASAETQSHSFRSLFWLPLTELNPLQ